MLLDAFTDHHAGITRDLDAGFLEAETLRMQAMLQPYRRRQVQFRGRMMRSLQEHQRIVDFWTKDKVAQAKPRDFVRDPATGTFSEAALAASGAVPVHRAAASARAVR